MSSSSGSRPTPPRPYAASGTAWQPGAPTGDRTDDRTDDRHDDAPAGEPGERGEPGAVESSDASGTAWQPGGRPVPQPHFRALGEAESLALLGRHQVGRLAYAHLGHVNIVPIHYVYADGWLYGRTGPGSKLTALRHHPWVAFEVDEVDDAFEWRSVVVRGALYLIARDGPAAERARWERAVELLRRIVPGTMTAADPTPERATVFRIHLGELTGRMARAR